MPRYDYDCAACGRRFEVVHGVHVDGPTSCPLCGKGPVLKAISAPAVHFKGSGWAKKERHSASASGASKSTSDPTGDKTGDKAPDKTGDKPSSGGDGTAETPRPTPSKSAEAGAASTTD